MNNTGLAVIITIVFSIVGVVGDYFLKLASAKDESLKSPAFYVGFVLYASTAFGWVFVMKHLKLATVGVVYSISMVLLLTAVGVVVFKESLNGYEIAGLAMAVGSLLLLYSILLIGHEKQKKTRKKIRMAVPIADRNRLHCCAFLCFLWLLSNSIIAADVAVRTSNDYVF